jgi:hypothetical protein
VLEFFRKYMALKFFGEEKTGIWCHKTAKENHLSACGGK